MKLADHVSFETRFRDLIALRHLATPDFNPPMNGIHCEVTPGKILLMAADGICLGVLSLPVGTSKLRLTPPEADKIVFTLPPELFTKGSGFPLFHPDLIVKVSFSRITKTISLEPSEGGGATFPAISVQTLDAYPNIRPVIPHGKPVRSDIPSLNTRILDRLIHVVNELIPNTASTSSFVFHHFSDGPVVVQTPLENLFLLMMPMSSSSDTTHPPIPTFLGLDTPDAPPTTPTKATTPTPKPIRLPEEIDKDIDRCRVSALEAMSDGDYEGAIQDLQEIIALKREYEDAEIACL